MKISTSEFRKGLKIEMDGVPYKIVDLVHVQQKRRAVLRTKLKNVLTGATAERSFISGDSVEKPDLEEKRMEFLYADGDVLIFMDLETYEQISIDSKVIEDIVPYMKENEQVTVLFYNGNPISAELPQFIEVEIAETEPGIKGNTVTTSFKPAKLATGGNIMVPLFINEGDIVKLHSDDFSYVERVKN